MANSFKNSWSRLKNWIARFFPSYITRLRYDAAVEAAQRELETIEKPGIAEAAHLEAAQQEQNTTKPRITKNPYFEAAQNALNKARNEKKDISYSWCYIHEAQVYTLLIMPENERKARTQALRIEIAEKVPLWRKKQAEALIGLPDEPREATPEDVAEAMRIRNDYFDTQFTRLAYRRKNLNIVGALLIALLVVVFITGSFCCRCSDSCSIWIKALLSLEFGSLGACLSMAYTLTSTPVTAKIPEHLMSGFIVLARMGIGATCAVVSLMLLQSGMLANIINKNLYTDDYGYIVVAFIAGFSERWFMRVIDKVSGDSKNKEK